MKKKQNKRIFSWIMIFAMLFTQVIQGYSIRAFAAEIKTDILYSRDFNDGNKDGIVRVTGRNNGPSTVTFENDNGALKETINGTGNVYFIDNKFQGFADGTYEAKIKTSDIGRVMLMVRYTDDKNFLCVGNSDDKTTWGYQVMKNGQIKNVDITTTGPQLKADTVYAFKVKCEGTKVTLYLDDVEVFTVDGANDFPTEAGKVGVRSWFTNRTLYIDDILCKKIATEVVPEPPTEPMVKVNTIESNKLKVTISEEFPMVSGYQWKASGALMYGQQDGIKIVKINDKEYTPDISFEKLADNKALYKMNFKDINLLIDAEMEVTDNVLKFTLKNIEEKSETKVNLIEIPNHNLIAVRSNQKGAALAGARMYNKVSGSGDTFTSLTDSKAADSKPVGYMYAFLNTEQLSAGLWTNSVYDNPSGPTARENFRIQKQTVQKDDYYNTGLWSGAWTYRANGMTEADLTPTVKIAITPDANKDGMVDWQDGAIAFRDIMSNPLGADKIPELVVQRIAHNFGSQATNPFLKTLDETKKVYLATDGLGQNVLLKGYGNEGHDSAHPDYGDIGKRQGGAEEMNTLINTGHEYNAEFGVHVNATEAYPEAKAFSEELVDKTKPAWDWIDQSYYINTRYDATSGNRLARFNELKKQVPNLDFIYLDVWYGDGWNSKKIAENVNSLGWRLETEFPNTLEDYATWNHWSADKNYGGSDMKGFNSQIARFIRNHQKDTWIIGDPLLGGTELVAYEGWTKKVDYDAMLKTTFDTDLPTKYLQHFPIMKWTNNTINLEDNVTVSNVTGTRTITKDGREILRGNSYLIPWEPKTEEKLYHWNLDGGTSTWSLPLSWSNLSSVKLYKLTDQGKEFVKDVKVSNGEVTITAEASTAYVVYKSEEDNKDVKWGEGTPLKDPGFNSASLKAWNLEGEGAYIERNNIGQYELKVGSGKGVALSQQLTGLSEGVYSASVYVEVNGKRNATIGVQNSEGKEFTNYTESSIAENYIGADSKHTDPNGIYEKRMQRMRVLFDVPKGSSTANLYLKVGEGEDTVTFDDVRIVKTERALNPTGAYFVEDFENIDQGLFPFVKGPAGPSGGVNDPRVHLSELNAPYTQKGWNGKTIDDVINGNWSIKAHKERVGVLLQTIPQNLRFVPGKAYRVTFKYELDKDGAYGFIIGDKAEVTYTKPLKYADTPTTYTKEFVASDSGESWIGISCIKGNVSDFVLDDLMVEEIEAASPEEKEIVPVDINTIPASQMTATATSIEPGVNPASSAIDGNHGTNWHTRWDKSEPLPQSITINLGGEYEINKVEALPRQSGSNGIITKYELYVSSNGTDYTKVSEGDWIADNSLKTVTFDKIKASSVKLTALEGVNGFASLAEMKIYKSPVSIIGAESIKTVTSIGKEPRLPEVVMSNLSDGSEMTLPVKWDNISKESYLKTGSFKVEGAINGSEVKASATVTVNEFALLEMSPVKIMALGDEITKGYNVNGGYRTKLWELLNKEGLAKYVNFVGSQRDGGSELGDQEHEGHTGWTICGDLNQSQYPGISDYINTWMNLYSPDIVMLQIGTNDILNEADKSSLPKNLNSLVDKICGKLPSNGKLYLATLTPLADQEKNELVIKYNEAVKEIVELKAKDGKPVYLVDMYKAISTEDLMDGVHPSASGYDKMGAEWFEALKNARLSVMGLDEYTINVSTKEGVLPILPNTVTIANGDGTYKDSEITWNKINAESYKKAGKFEVEGTIKDTETKAIAVVTVEDETAPIINVEGVKDGEVYVNAAIKPIVKVNEEATVTYKLDGNEVESFGTITAIGMHTLEVIAVDNSGNKSELKISFEIKASSEKDDDKTDNNNTNVDNNSNTDNSNIDNKDNNNIENNVTENNSVIDKNEGSLVKTGSILGMNAIIITGLIILIMGSTLVLNKRKN